MLILTLFYLLHRRYFHLHLMGTEYTAYEVLALFYLLDRSTQSSVFVNYILTRSINCLLNGLNLNFFKSFLSAH